MAQSTAGKDIRRQLPLGIQILRLVLDEELMVKARIALILPSSQDESSYREATLSF